MPCLMFCFGRKFAFELLEIGSSAPLSQASMMFYGVCVLPCMGKIANPTNDNRTYNYSLSFDKINIPELLISCFIATEFRFRYKQAMYPASHEY